MSTEIIFGIVLVLVIVSVAIYYVARFLKGKVEFTLERTSFHFGETVFGNGKITAKKEIICNSLNVMLYCEEEYYEYNHNNERTRKTRKIYEDKISIDSNFTLKENEEKNFEFQICTPCERDRHIENNIVGDIYKVMNSINRDERHWYIEVEVDAKGVDLSSKEKIYIG